MDGEVRVEVKVRLNLDPKTLTVTEAAAVLYEGTSCETDDDDDIKHHLLHGDAVGQTVFYERGVSREDFS